MATRTVTTSAAGAMDVCARGQPTQRRRSSLLEGHGERAVAPEPARTRMVVRAGDTASLAVRCGQSMFHATTRKSVYDGSLLVGGSTFKLTSHLWSVVVLVV